MTRWVVLLGFNSTIVRIYRLEYVRWKRLVFHTGRYVRQVFFIALCGAKRTLFSIVSYVSMVNMWHAVRLFILFLRWYYERIGCWLCQLFYDIMQWLWTVFYMIVSCFICRGSYILRQKKIDGDENDVQRFLGDWTFYENHKFSYGYISMPTVAALPDQRCFLQAGWADFFSRYVAI